MRTQLPWPTTKQGPMVFTARCKHGACLGLGQVLTHAGVQDVERLLKVPGWRPTRPELAALLAKPGRHKGRNRAKARK